MGRKSAPLYLCSKMSEAKFRQMLKADTRKIWLTRWPPRAECLKNAERRVQIDTYKNGNPKMGKEHQCASCREWFPQERNSKGTLKPHVEVNHKITVGGFSDDIHNWHNDIASIYKRLLVSVEDLECLCKVCHQQVTNSERVNKK